MEEAGEGLLDPDVAETAGLAHDLGHPPFGHVAETTLSKLVGSEGHFEGNAQSFRIVTQLDVHSDLYSGLNLTRASLNALLKYPWPRGETTKKFGFYADSEAEDFEFARKGSSGRVRSLEAEIMDFADDITFALHDTEDFFRAGLIPLHTLRFAEDGRPETGEASRLLDDILSRRERMGLSLDLWDQDKAALADVVAWLTMGSAFHGTVAERVRLRQATSGLISTFVGEGISIEVDEDSQPRACVDPFTKLRLDMLKQLVWTYVIDRPSLATQQSGHIRIIEALFEFFRKAAEEGSDRLLPARFRNIGAVSASRLAADIICSLTDNQALDLYLRISGTDPGRTVPFTL